MNATGWLLVEKTYRFVFYYRPVLCWNCHKFVLVKNASFRHSPEGLLLPRWRLYCRKCAEFF